MKKILAILLVLAMCTALFAACTKTDDTPATPAPPPATPPPPPEEPPPTDPTRFEELGLEIDANGNVRFIEQRTIRVEAWDRSDYETADTAFTEYLAEQMLEIHNVVIEEFVKVGRWSEQDDIVLLLAEGQAPDVCVTYNFEAVNEFARQGAITNLEPLFADSGDLFPNLWSWLGSSCLYTNQDWETGEIWSFRSRQPFNQRYVPFVREDWVAALGMDLPTNIDEFEAYLYAAKDNAADLLGSDASQIVPLHMTDDPGWVAGQMVQSFVPNAITDKELYIYGWGGERNFFYPGVKEAIRYLNKWFNDGLIHPDFALFSSGDDTADNLIKAGFVGAVASHSFDQPYRDGENGWNGSIQNLVGPDANFIAVDTFKNDADLYRKLLGPAMDRTLFIPASSTEPIAALLYYDMLCRPEIRFTLQLGFEGINHEVLDNGAYKAIAVEDPADPFAMRSGRNHDIAIVTHSAGLGLEPVVSAETEALTAALGYEGVDPRLIVITREVQSNHARLTPNISATINAAEGITDLTDMGNAVFVRAIAASVADFDSVYDAEMKQLLDNYGNAVIAERTAIWEALYGDAVMLPD